jgi:hypothetical protein
MPIIHASVFGMLQISTVSPRIKQKTGFSPVFLLICIGIEPATY